jgi:hypothetical protein
MKRRLEIVEGRCGNAIVLRNWKVRGWAFMNDNVTSVFINGGIFLD